MNCVARKRLALSAHAWWKHLTTTTPQRTRTCRPIESWDINTKRVFLGHGCLRRKCGLTMRNVRLAERRITKEQVRRNVANSPTMDSFKDSLIETRRSRSPRRMLGAWCPTSRPAGRPQQTIRHAYISTLKRLGFEVEKGQLKEWMAVARYRSAWGRNVEYKLDFPPGSFTNLRRH
jgi:hypothetical protein